MPLATDLYKAPLGETSVNHSIHFAPLTEAQALAVLDWRYPGIYSFYNIETDDPADVLIEMLDGTHFGATDEQADPIGFWAVGYAAQVPGGHTSGAYDRHPGLDIGLGLRPDMMGLRTGLGPAFVDAGLAYMKEQFGDISIRLSVATFNERAIHVYTRAGFVPHETFYSDSSAGPAQFVLMSRAPDTTHR